MEAFYCDIPTVRSKPSHSFIVEIISAAMVASLLIFIIKTEIEIYQFNKKQDEK